MPDSDPFATHFASAERLSPAEIAPEIEKLKGNSLLQNLINAVPDPIVMLNQQRQIVSTNQQFVNICGAKNASEILGSRPGEALKCSRLHAGPNGCGTTKFCITCGAVQAILNSQTNQEDCEECRVMRSTPDGEEALDLRVWAKEISIDGQKYTLFSVHDISDEKRRQVLEHMFFHDISNSLGGVSGLSQLLGEINFDPETEQIVTVIVSSLEQIRREIESYSVLASAEKGELQVHPEEVDVHELLKSIAKQFDSHSLAKEKRIVISPIHSKVFCCSDPALVSRVLINLLKNALEASGQNQAITLSCAESKDETLLSVHNRGTMTDEVQAQVFTRSFSTKGAGRGIGTFGARLITERFLKGKISFTSSKRTGTTFEIRLPSLPMDKQIS